MASTSNGFRLQDRPITTLCCADQGSDHSTERDSTRVNGVGCCGHSAGQLSWITPKTQLNSTKTASYVSSAVLNVIIITVVS